MQPMSEAIDRELTWKESGCAWREYELQADGEVAARLRRPAGSLVVAETAYGLWSFERPGLRRSRVEVREAETSLCVAAFGSGWTGGGTLETARGRRFRWSPVNFWRSRWEWRDEGDTPLLRFESRQGPTKIGGRVKIERAATALPELDLLVVLGWYLLVMRARDSTHDAIASTAGTAGS